MRTCPPLERLRLLLDDGLSGPDLATLSEHLDRCADCRGALDRLSADPASSHWRHLRADWASRKDQPTDHLLSRLEHAGPPPSWTSARADSTVRLPIPVTSFPFAPAEYEILAEVGRGGVGVVYKARHVRLNRIVALKVLLSGEHAGAEDRARFQAEAEAASRLQHPNIVQIHDMGEHQGRPFLALEFVEGRSLTAQAGGAPQPPRAAAELVETVARALHYAHERGVIHRDLKPSNVLLAKATRPPTWSEGAAAPLSLSRDSGFTPKVTDFGLAKLLDRPGQTETGRILGTPSYMAPEQARGQGRSVTAAADTYALGAILYELLTGRPPFHGVTSVDTVVQVLHEEPVPPRRLQPKVPRDLETVCLKCLSKEPARRYGSAAELADDLRRFLDGRPVRATRMGLAAQGWRWCRRNPALAGLGAAVLLAVAAGFVGVTWGYVHADRARGQEALARAGEARQRDQAELALYYSRIALAEREWLANNVARAEYLLDRCLPDEGQPDRRGWEWHYLKRLCHADLLTFKASRLHLRGITYSPDGKHLVTAAGLPNYSGRDRARGELASWDAGGGRQLGTFEGLGGEAVSAAYSPDGRRLVCLGSDHKARLWDVASRQKLAEFDARATYETGAAAAFSPDGQTLAVPNGEAVELRRVADGELVGRLGGHRRRAGVVAYSPDGTRLASADEAGVVRVWDVAGRRELWRAAGGRCAVAFSPDGSLLAVSDREAVKVCETATGRDVAILRGHDGMVRGLAWHPSGRWLASAASDQTVRLWEAATGRQERVLRGHRSPALSVAYSPDGRRLASGDSAGVVKLWDTERDQRAGALSPAPHTCALAFSGDGRRLLAARPNRGSGGVAAFDTSTWEKVADHHLDLIDRQEWPLKYVDFSADGRLFAGPTGPEPTTVGVWEVQTGKEVIRLTGHRAGVRAVAFSRDGTRLASAAWSRKRDSAGELIVWPLNGGEPGRALFVVSTPSPVQCLTFSPDGSRVIGGDLGTFAADRPRGKDGGVVVWDAATGRQLRRWTAHPGWVQAVAVSPDGRLLASVGFEDERNLNLWDAATGELLHALQAPPPATTVAFSPDGRRLAAAGYEGVVQLWDPATGQDILTLRGPAPQMTENEANDTHIAFSPDGTLLAVNVWTKAIHLFDAGPRGGGRDAP